MLTLQDKLAMTFGTTLYTLLIVVAAFVMAGLLAVIGLPVSIVGVGVFVALLAAITGYIAALAMTWKA